MACVYEHTHFLACVVLMRKGELSNVSLHSHTLPCRSTYSVSHSPVTVLTSRNLNRIFLCARRRIRFMHVSSNEHVSAETAWMKMGCEYQGESRIWGDPWIANGVGHVMCLLHARECVQPCQLLWWAAAEGKLVPQKGCGSPERLSPEILLVLEANKAWGRKQSHLISCKGRNRVLFQGVWSWHACGSLDPLCLISWHEVLHVWWWYMQINGRIASLPLIMLMWENLRQTVPSMHCEEYVAHGPCTFLVHMTELEWTSLKTQCCCRSCLQRFKGSTWVILYWLDPKWCPS